MGYKLHLQSTLDHSLQAYSDADWADDKDDKCSIGILHFSKIQSYQLELRTTTNCCPKQD
jgi:hypothetical protein